MILEQQLDRIEQQLAGALASIERLRIAIDELRAILQYPPSHFAAPHMADVEVREGQKR